MTPEIKKFWYIDICTFFTIFCLFLLLKGCANQRGCNFDDISIMATPGYFKVILFCPNILSITSSTRYYDVTQAIK